MLRLALNRTRRSFSTNASAKNIDFSLKNLEKRPNHQKFAEHLKNDKVPVVIGVGPAGCGKTLLPCAHAINRLATKNISKIVITRPAVAMDEEHGFLPGDLESKMMPWLIPIYDCFKEYVTIHRLKEYISNEDIEICPLSYIRGRTFNNCWIIADEVQNATVNQMKTLLTRVGNNSKIILTGDLEQCDIQEPNGLRDFLRRHDYFRNDLPDKWVLDNMTAVVNFNEEDVMRSELVKYVIDVYKY